MIPSGAYPCPETAPVRRSPGQKARRAPKQKPDGANLHARVVCCKTAGIRASAPSRAPKRCRLVRALRQQARQPVANGSPRFVPRFDHVEVVGVLELDELDAVAGGARRVREGAALSRRHVIVEAAVD